MIRPRLDCLRFNPICGLLLCTCLYLLAGAAWADSALPSSNAVAGDAQLEQRKLLQYQRRIPRLEQEIIDTRAELALLRDELDGARIKADSLAEQLGSARHKLQLNETTLQNASSREARARLNHAEFEFFLSDRKYNNQLVKLNELSTLITEKSAFLQSRIDLLRRNRQGLVWQQQILKRLRQHTAEAPTARQLANS